MPPKTVARVRDHVLNECIVPLLMKHDFHKQGIAFERKTIEIVHKLSFDFSIDRHADCAIITMDVSVAVPKIAKLLSGLEFLGVSDGDLAELSLVGTNIGYLRAPYRYAKWSVLPDTPSDSLASTLTAEIEHHGLPFFDRIMSLADLASMLATGELGFLTVAARPYTESAILLLTHDIQGGLERLEAYQRNVVRDYQVSPTARREIQLHEVERAVEYFRQITNALK